MRSTRAAEEQLRAAAAVLARTEREKRATKEKERRLEKVARKTQRDAEAEAVKAKVEADRTKKRRQGKEQERRREVEGELDASYAKVFFFGLFFWSMVRVAKGAYFVCSCYTM